MLAVTGSVRVNVVSGRALHRGRAEALSSLFKEHIALCALLCSPG